MTFMPSVLHTRLMSSLIPAVYGSITKGGLLPSSSGEFRGSSSHRGGQVAEWMKAPVLSAGDALCTVIQAPDQTPLDMGWMVGPEVQVVVGVGGVPVDSDVQAAILLPREKTPTPTATHTSNDGEAVQSHAANLLGDRYIMVPTRVTSHSESLIDLLLTTNPNIFSSSRTAPLLESDHLMIFGECYRKVALESTVSYVRNYKKCKLDSLLSDLGSALWQVMDTFDDIDDKWMYWKDLFIVDRHAPLMKVRVKKDKCEWLGGDI